MILHNICCEHHTHYHVRTFLNSFIVCVDSSPVSLIFPALLSHQCPPVVLEDREGPESGDRKIVFMLLATNELMFLWNGDRKMNL